MTTPTTTRLGDTFATIAGTIYGYAIIGAILANHYTRRAWSGWKGEK